jgi:hypothetical protein
MHVGTSVSPAKAVVSGERCSAASSLALSREVLGDELGERCRVGSLAMRAVTGVVLDGVDPGLAGNASAVFDTFRQVGGATAIAVFGSLIAASPTLLPGMRASPTFAAALLLGTVLMSLQVRTRTAPS